MKIKYISLFGIFCLCLIFGFQNAKAQQITRELSANIPNVEEQLDSENVLERIAVLDKLVVYQWDSDVVNTILPYNLSADDYAYVIKKIFEKDLTQIDEKTVSQTFSRVEFLMRKFKLNQFAKNLVDYIPKFMPNGQTDFPRVGIQYGILGVLKALNAKDFAPQIALLLQPAIKNLHREALSTLVELHAKEAIPSLISLLYSKDSNERYYALQSLVKVEGKPAAPQIAKLLNDENPNNRYWALDALIKLDAREQSGKFWQLINSNQTGQTEIYAIAGLVRFDDARAIEIAGQKLLENNEEDRYLLENLIKVNAVQIVPKLVYYLENADYSRGNAYKFNTGVISALEIFNARETAPVLRKILNTFAARIPAIQALGSFEDKEAVDDLLEIFRANLPKPPDRITNKTFDSAEAAVALAKIGDKRTFKELIDAAENPRFPYRSQIIIELNKHIDSDLWQRTQEVKIKSREQNREIVSIKELTEIFSSETGIPVILHFELGKDTAKRAPLAPPYKDTKGYPWAYVPNDVSLLNSLRDFPKIISAGTTPQNFTFIFDDKQIHILTVEKAIDWWRKNILSKLEQNA